MNSFAGFRVADKNPAKKRIFIFSEKKLVKKMLVAVLAEAKIIITNSGLAYQYSLNDI